MADGDCHIRRGPGRGRFEGQLQSLGLSILDQFGGVKWQQVKLLQSEAEKTGDDFAGIADTYRRAADLLTDANEDVKARQEDDVPALLNQ